MDLVEIWNLDQYYEIKVSESGWDFDLDKTMYSGRFPLVSKVDIAVMKDQKFQQ